MKLLLTTFDLNTKLVKDCIFTLNRLLLRRTKNLILSICLLILSIGYGIAQENTGSLQRSEKHGSTDVKSIEETPQLLTDDEVTLLNSTAKKNKLNEYNEIIQKYLGVSSLEDAEYALRKQALKDENPLAYEQFVKELTVNRSNGKATISRSQYDVLPAGRKAVIDANPDRYIIKD